MSVDPVDLLRGLIRVPSVNPPGDEGQITAIVEGQLSAAGVETRVLAVEVTTSMVRGACR